MNVSYKWLKNYLEVDLTPEQVAKALTSIGLEVGSIDEIESVKGGLKGLVVGEVLSCEIHENSDHLHVTSINLGEKDPYQIVCGAPNVAKGQKVIVATIGTTLYNGEEEFKIKKSKIRGVESFGMICSASEIGIGTSHEGIIELPNNVPVGIPASEYYNVNSDYLIEVDITPNRVEAASHFGIARDLATYLKQNKIPYKLTKPSVKTFKPTQENNQLKVIVDDVENCPRYTGVSIKNVKVSESPEWLKEKLISIGLRPINNIVDITNYVLHELGHPLHAYDSNQIVGETIIVKKLQENTKFVTLDEVERSLSQNDLMVCDQKGGLCIAGIFGGKHSGVTENTTNIFLECAYFNPTSVRKTARHHVLSTDSSFRFERGVDPNDTEYVLKRAALLIQEIAGGEIVGDIIDIYPNPIEKNELELKYSKINALIGKNIDQNTIQSILRSLEIEILKEDDDTLFLAIPTYRTDVTRDVDVIEDILRIYGYNNIEFNDSVKSNLSYQTETDRKYEQENTISELLTGAGFNEILNNSLTKEEYYTNLSNYPKEKCVKIINALSTDLNVMRQTLLFGGLETIEYNNNRKISDLKIYEFGNCYTFSVEKTDNQKILAPYSEDFKLGIWITGSNFTNSWNYEVRKSSFFDLKSYVENILLKIGLRNKYTFEQAQDDLYSNKLTLKVNNTEMGILGVVNKYIQKKFDLKSDVFFAELSWTKLMNAVKKQTVTFTEISKYPIVERDFALLVDKSVQFSQIEKIALKADRKLLKNVRLFDVYEGKNLPEGKKSYAVKFNIQDEEKTLTDKQIDTLMQKIYASLEKELGAQLR